MSLPLATCSRPRPALFQGFSLCRHSHVGARAIPVPAEVSLKMSPAVATPSMPLHLRNSTLMHVKGPKGSLTVPLQSFVEHTWPSDEQQPQISFTVKDESVRRQRAAWGLTRQLAANAIHGVSQGHTATLQLVGVGYRAHLEGSDKLALKLGYPNLVMENIPQGIEVSVDSPTEITLKGADKAQLGQFAAQIRRWRKPEPYNGKGIFVNGETIRRKEGKRK